MNKTKKILLFALAALLLVAVSVGGTIAYLTAETDPVTNTFAASEIAIELKEHKLAEDGKTLDTSNEEVTSNEGYLLYPGETLKKDPFVRVTEGNCYIFVEVVNAATDYVTFSAATGWKKVTDAEGMAVKGYQGGTVYAWANDDGMKAVTETDSEVYFLADNEIKVKTSVTADMLTDDALKDVKLDFYAYAIQADHLGSGFTAPMAVWGLIPNPNASGN